MESKDMAQIVVTALEDKKANDLKVIDISELSVIADYFIIASGENRNQIQTLADHVKKTLEKEGCYPKQIEGYQTANWILMDYSDIIIHIFSEEDRLFYDLERIWRDGKIMEIDELKK